MDMRRMLVASLFFTALIGQNFTVQAGELLKESIKIGKGFDIVFNRDIGNNKAGENYNASYRMNTKTWRACNSQGGCNDYGYGPGSPGNLSKDVTPEANQICINGTVLQFDSNGVVYDAGQKVGRLSIRPQ
jgi:hypothetical protein